MPKQNQIDPRKFFVPRFLPWLLGVVMLAFYWFTLNRWVNVQNINQVATVSGWVWQPQLFGPLQFLATYPFRWLPLAQIPLALNLFSAVCGAAALGLLARSVALLPRDHTESERQREKSDFVFLTGWQAWFPPVVAVLFAGLQLTFWQHATSYSGEMFQLLLFVVVVWLLLEYRLDEQVWRLILAAFIYGAGITDNWALVAFFPLFLAALIWLRKLEFFNLEFLARMALAGLMGISFFLLLPLLAKFNGNFTIGFWEALRPSWRLDWNVIKCLGQDTLRNNLALMSLTTLLPVLVAAIRWNKTFGDKSQLGISLAGHLLHVVYAVIFGACVWVMFDPPFSPHQLALGTPALTLYILAALAIGHYCGYFLLVFGKNTIPSRRNPRSKSALPRGWKWLCSVIVTGTILLSALMLTILFYKNVPLIRDLNDDSLQKFARLATQNLPPNGAVLLCDSDDPNQIRPLRAFLIQAMLAHEGRWQKYLVADTQSLNWPPYHRYLHKNFPKQWPLLVSKDDMKPVNQIGLLSMINQLTKSNAVFYANPSFGYYFEQFYQEPHGMIYQLKELPTNNLVPPTPDKTLITENESFWSQAIPLISPGIKKALSSPDYSYPANFFDWVLMHLHATADPNPNPVIAGAYYSRSLNFWGVQLQRAGQLDPAATAFNNAQVLNPENVTAGINRAFNDNLRAGSANVVDVSGVTADQFGRYRNWNEVLNANGPFDETSFCFENGVLLVRGGLLRQAIAPFARVRQLSPDNYPTRLWLGQVYLFNRLPDPALEALHDPITQPRRFGLNAKNSTQLNVLVAAAYFQKNDLPRGSAILDAEVDRHLDDDNLLIAATQAYFLRGLYTNALRVIDRKLAQMPDNPQWLFGCGYAHIQMGNYPQAITALTRVLEISTNDPTARFNRALAYLQSDRLNDARADYAKLLVAYTNSFQVAYGLAEVAWRQHATNDAIRNYQLYLVNAPTNSVEFKTVRDRLKLLRGK